MAEIRIKTMGISTEETRANVNETATHEEAFGNNFLLCT